MWCWYCSQLLCTLLARRPCSLSTARNFGPVPADLTCCTHTTIFFWITNWCIRCMLLHCTCYCVPVTTSQCLQLSADLRDRPLCSIHVASCPSLKLKWAQSNAISTCLRVYLSALLPSSWYSSLNLGSPQTTHHHYVWLWRRDESRWPVCDSGELIIPAAWSSMRLGCLGLLVLSSEERSGHNPSKRSCLHCGNRHE